MQFKINGQQPFQILSDSFSISPSLEGYTLQVSADGENYSDLFQVSPNTTKMCTGMANGSYYRLSGNNSEVTVNWRTTCKGGEGGGGGQYILPPATEQTLGGIKVGDGLSITNDGTLSTSGGTDPEAIQEAIDANNELLEGGDIVVGMAKQLYSPDGTTSDGTFAYRTTAGDEDVTSGPANLMKVMGNATYPQTEYNDSAVLMREGSEVEGFDADIYWGDTLETLEWSSLSDLTPQQKAELGYKIIRANNDINGYGKIRFLSSTPSYPNNYIGLDMEYNNGVWAKATSNVEVVEENRWIWKHPDNASIIIGDVYYEDGWLYVTITNPSTVARWSSLSLTGFNSTNIQLVEGAVIPNDIPYGESTYTYDGSEWDASLPQAITAMTINGETYVPESGDELIVTRIVSKQGEVSYPAPDSFVSLGLNSFTKDGSPINLIAGENRRIGSVSIVENDYGLYQDTDYDIYAIKAVTGLADGYIVYHKSGSSVSIAGVADKDIENLDICYSATVHTSTYDVVYPTDDYPYIVFSVRKDEDNTICVHPRWSGYMDEAYEDYSESIIDLHNITIPLLSVGDVHNVWDFKNQQLQQNISVSDYSAQAVQDLIDGGKELGTDFDFDEYHIYEVLDESISIPIEFDNEYDANDFSVEYFTDGNALSTPVYAETWYMNNLVDKLRRMENNFIHLTSLDIAGEEGKTYEYNGRLFKWVNGAGVWGEWLSGWDSNNQYPDSNGPVSVIFKYSTLPIGEFCRVYDFNNLRTYLVYDGQKITAYTDSAHTTVHTAVTIGCVDVNMSNQTYENYKVLLTWTDGKLIFKTGRGASLRNRADTAVSTPHYEALDMSVAASNDAGTGDMGLPIWNKEGIVIGKKVGYNSRAIYFNTTGYTNSKNFLVSGNWGGPDRIFVPSQGGTQGQVLTSNGNSAEPVWETMIKAQKITSDAYEALAVKDPNTLYIIDDE